MVPQLNAPVNSVSGYGDYSMRRNYQKPYKYPGAGKKYGRVVGKYVGGRFPRIGESLGADIGGVVGKGAHSLVKTITGFGDYQVKKNSLVYNVDAVPEFSSGNERCTMICHREFVSDVKSSVDFVVNEYRINPAILTTFPWLAQVAANWEQYVVQGMVFEFKTTSATAIGSTNTGLGTVVMATQYNSLAPSFANKQQMENYEFSQSSIPSHSILHPIECDPTQTQCGGIFNTWDTNAASGDNRLYDIGRFSIATVGMQAADSTIGELWVSYKICLLKPRLNQFQGVYEFFSLDVASVSAANPLGNTALATIGDKNTGIVSLSSTNRINIDSNFVGLLELTIAYNCDGANPHAITPPCVSFISSTLYDRTNNFIAVGATTVAGQNQTNSTAATSVSKTNSCQFYIQCNGGKESGNVNPYLTFANFSQTGMTFNYATVVVLSVDYVF